MTATQGSVLPKARVTAAHSGLELPPALPVGSAPVLRLLPLHLLPGTIQLPHPTPFRDVCPKPVAVPGSVFLAEAYLRIEKSRLIFCLPVDKHVNACSNSQLWDCQ